MQRFTLAIAVLVFIVGVVLCFTTAGFIIGIPLCVVALFIGGKRRKVWKCRQCGSIVDRA